MIFTLDEILAFPDPALAEENGLLAIGGDLSVNRLLLAYTNGIFPWYAEDEPICWFSPHERCIILPAEVHISDSMKKVLAKNIFKITEDLSFEKVMENCKVIKRKDQAGTWISEAMQAAYLQLHKTGMAHSVEVWQGPILVGGLYGVVMNKVFCGESMFSRVSNASKAALIWLCKSMKYNIIDCQLPNPYLISMGAIMVTRKEYMGMLWPKT